jgi:hypothetical protein
MGDFVMINFQQDLTGYLKNGLLILREIVFIILVNQLLLVTGSAF